MTPARRRNGWIFVAATLPLVLGLTINSSCRMLMGAHAIKAIWLGLPLYWAMVALATGRLVAALPKNLRHACMVVVAFYVLGAIVAALAFPERMRMTRREIWYNPCVSLRYLKTH